MLRKLIPSLAIVGALFASPVTGATVKFQTGTTMLPNMTLYDGTIDTEFRSGAADVEHGENETLTVDNDDGGHKVQAAIRFENLLISEGGLVPDGLDADDILFAELRFWSDSGSDTDANIAFHRIVGIDQDKGDIWEEDDTWQSLGGDLFASGGGVLDCNEPGFPDLCPIQRGVWKDPFTLLPAPGNPMESLETADFSVLNPDLASDDRLEIALDGGLPLADAIEEAFIRLDATAAVRSWLVDGAPNLGWSVNNDTGNGWDFPTSELTEELMSEWSEAGLLPEYFRPSLTVVFNSGPILDLDGDGDVDEDDFADFLNELGVELDGPIAVGSTGDFDFDRDVDLDDFKFFKANYADQHAEFPPLPGGGGLTVPEPAAGALAVFAALGFAVFRRRKSV